MASVGSLDRDRYEIDALDGGVIEIRDLPISQRASFLQWYSRFKVLWLACKAAFPEGTLQAFYEPKYIDEAGQLTDNPLHNPALAWCVRHLIEGRGISLDRISMDVAYGLLVEYRGEPAVFDQIMVNYPTQGGKPLEPNIDPAIDLSAMLLNAGFKSDDIQWALERIPFRELQQMLAIAKQKADEESQPKKKKSGLSDNPADWNIPKPEKPPAAPAFTPADIKACAEAFAADFGGQMHGITSGTLEAKAKGAK